MGFDPDADKPETLLKKILETLTDILMETQGLREDIKRLPHDLAQKMKS